MPFTHERTGDTVVFTFIGDVSHEDINEFFALSYDFYDQIGEAYGIIIDIRGYQRISISKFKTIQKNLAGLESTVPTVLVLKRISTIKAIALTFDTITGRGVNHTGFCKTVPDAYEWLDKWFAEHHESREALRGVKTSVIPGSNSQFAMKEEIAGGTSSSSRDLIINNQRAFQSGKER